MKKDKRCYTAKTIDKIRLNKEEIVGIQKKNLLKCSSEGHGDEHQNIYLVTQVQNGLTCYKNCATRSRRVPSFQTIL